MNHERFCHGILVIFSFSVAVYYCAVYSAIQPLKAASVLNKISKQLSRSSPVAEGPRDTQCCMKFLFTRTKFLSPYATVYSIYCTTRLHRRRKGSVVGGHHGDCGARAYNGGLGAESPAGSRGRAPGHGVWGGLRPLKLKAFWSLDVQRSRQI